MRLLKTIIISFLIFLVSSVIFTQPAYATVYDLLGPTETLTMGQNVTFTINIDTQGTNLTQGQIGMTYDTQYLELVNAQPGNTFTTVTYSPVSTGKILITGSGSNYNGAGILAYVTFKLIAQQPGSTEICVLWPPTATGTPIPIAPTTPLTQPTNAPLPTTLLKTGETKPTLYAGLFGIVLLAPAMGIYILRKSKKIK